MPKLGLEGLRLTGHTQCAIGNFKYGIAKELITIWEKKVACCNSTANMSGGPLYPRETFSRFALDWVTSVELPE